MDGLPLTERDQPSWTKEKNFRGSLPESDSEVIHNERLLTVVQNISIGISWRIRSGTAGQGRGLCQQCSMDRVSRALDTS